MVLQAAVIIPAAGSGSRMGLKDPKQFLALAGVPMLVRTILVFEQVPTIVEIVVAASAEHLNRVQALIDEYGLKRVKVVAGGIERQDSVANGLAALGPDINLVLVHDGARPLISSQIVEKCLEAVAEHGAAMVAIPAKDTLKKVDSDNIITATMDRRGVWQAQTPQGARISLLKEAMLAAGRDGFIGTDEAALLERINCPVMVVPGSEKNIKITTPEDLQLAEAILMQNEQNTLRVGQGYDAHRLVKDRPLVLGGVIVPHDMGLLGHSDADVLTHALCDAILGAIGAGDIGNHFPDTDEKYKGISSLLLLEQVMKLAEKKGFFLTNADITVLAQRPKLASYFPLIREKLARICKVGPADINCKASTTEKMGFVGREEGMAAQAVVMMRRK